MLWAGLQALHAPFAAFCVALVAAFFLLVLTPRLHGRVRARLRPAVVFSVEAGLSWCIAAQRWRSPLLTALFTHSSHSVSVPFYVSCLLARRQQAGGMGLGAVAETVARLHGPGLHANVDSCQPPSLNNQASFLPALFWLGLPELGRSLVLLVRFRRAPWRHCCRRCRLFAAAPPSNRSPCN